MNLYDFSVPTANGEEESLAVYQGKVLLIVNTASKCAFTSQYQELEELHRSYASQGLVILAFPCNQFLNQEPDSNSAIQQFCQLNYGVTFPVFGKLNVKGPAAHPLFQYLTEQAPGLFGKPIRWNFTKFLVDASGHVRHRYAPSTKPSSFAADIEALLSEIASPMV
ncbi:glutathione peroxidase [Azotosporobacter soli]|uniref:glutathione peroxidase n=1 Tax=Azotosporobacter soli TaxID=3055040 RepID=UPI0031FF41B1